MTTGPSDWISINGHRHGEYWVFQSDHFHVEWQPILEVFTGGVTAKLSGTGSADLEPEPSLEELVRRAKPTVVNLKGVDKSGSAFFVTDTGVIATNAHLARGEESLQTLLPGGQQLEAKAVHIDADLDIGPLKVQGREFPHLSLADATTGRQGESVLAIGNPGDAMLFSVTKGIVSAGGKFGNAGSGVWIQTDTPSNPPDVSTTTAIGSGTDSSALATSSAEMQRGSSNSPTIPQPAGAPIESDASQIPHGFGTVTITSDADGAEIQVNDKFVGNAPARLKLASGSHIIIVKVAGFAKWKRTTEILKDSQVTLKPVRERAQ